MQDQESNTIYMYVHQPSYILVLVIKVADKL